MTTALRQGAKVQVFPEATTRCGGALGEFRRAAFQAAIDAAVVVLPATLSYRDRDGRQTAAPAFVGDETLIASIRRTVAVTGLEITVRWLSPIPAIAGTGQWARDRANVARGVELAVARDLGVPVVRRRSSASQPQKDPVRTGPTRG
jgi:1-acyl-sn-glycerol-3-phosphate acyltransferase